MTHNCIPSLLGRGRATITGLAFFALLSNVLSPAALMVVAGMLDPDRDTVGLALCSPASGSDLPGKTKPGLLVHHCALCTVPAAALFRPSAGLVLPCETVGAAHPQLRTVSAAAPLRHGWMQARAPPAAA